MNTSLPIYDYKEQITKAVQTHAVTIITAETGSGKSTQVPQYLYHVGYDVVVTEPRRMAAWSLAQRVAEEMDTPLGEIVGFRTAFERKDSLNTAILYCTDGLELVRTLTDTTDRQRVLIIDEVHEWNCNIETLVGWCKKKVEEGWCTKVVIMSATLERRSLAEYFGGDVSLLEVPGKVFPVEFKQKWKEDLIPNILAMISEGRNTLVFVPGKREIKETIEKLREHQVNAQILPLHGELDTEEQKKCFKNYSIPKVVVATNVAQTSITIPDIDAVVDTGKERRSEAKDGIQGLFLRDISKADCLQRKGRAGRTKEGKYILSSDKPFEDREEFCVPEIQRSMLEQIVLRLASIEIDAIDFPFFHQPDVEELIRAKQTLIDLGALKENNEVTPIGYKMAKMPISVESARMIIEAEKYGVTEDVIKIASIIEIGTLLDREGSYQTFTRETESDLLAELDVWEALQKMKFIDFKELGINPKAYKRIKEQIQRMNEVLTGIVEITSTGDRKAIKRACLAGIVSHVYRHVGGGYYRNGDGIERILERKSCLQDRMRSNAIVGRPKVIEFEDRWNCKRKLHLVTMATTVTVEELKEVAPQFVTEEEIDSYYSSWEDVVKVTIRTYYKDINIGERNISVPNHPDYEKLKAEYTGNSITYYEERRQKAVVIDGKAFEIDYFYGGPEIEVDLKTLYHTEVKKVCLDDGTKVSIRCGDSYFGKKGNSIPDLRNTIERERVSNAWKLAKRRLPELKSYEVSSVVECIPYLGKKEIIRGNGGYGEPIYGFGCLSLQKNQSLQIELLEDEEKAEAKNKEAVEFLYGKTIQQNYSEKRFKFLKGKKGLSPKEQKVKEEFDSEVRALLVGLEISNIEERLAFLQEYYEVLVEDLKVA